jgi:RsbRD-like negative regulator of sigma factor
MPENFSTLFRQHQDILIRRWVDAICRQHHTELLERLPFEQIIEHYPEILDELAHLLDGRAAESEIVEGARRMRAHAHVRFQKGILIDEVARELILLRRVLKDFLWREGIGAAEGGLSEAHDVLGRVDLFVDEMITQAVVIYAANLRPPVETRTSMWPPPRRRKTDFPKSDDVK